MTSNKNHKPEEHKKGWLTSRRKTKLIQLLGYSLSMVGWFGAWHFWDKGPVEGLFLSVALIFAGDIIFILSD